MYADRSPDVFANMSAPPRSVVTLPRLPAVTAPETEAGASAAAPNPGTPSAEHGIPVGPGGGLLQSNALCIARIHVGESLAADPVERLRQLVARARSDTARRGAAGTSARTRAGDPPPEEMGEGALVVELAHHFRAMPWPKWVPAVGFLVSNRDPHAVPDPARARRGVRSPLMVARLVTAMRWPVFVRDAAPAFSGLLQIMVPNVVQEIWVPIRPGGGRP